ncbi:MAG: HK97 family phage prohead protease [Actinobacteria bacterium]|nr:HK97 family phage prohead protease [Actinomycetota bacterium]
MSNLIRDFVADIEIRSDGTGRTVHGILVPYNTVARVSDGGPAYEEMFVLGAFERDIEARNGDYRGVKFLYQHDHTEPIGRAVELREDASGLFGAFRVAKTSRGDEALELLREGVLDSFSIGFRPIDPAPGDPIKTGEPVVRTKASLRETSLVTFPAYAGALVAGVRAIEPEDLHGDVVVAEADTTGQETARTDQPTPDPDPAPAPLHSGLSPAQRRTVMLNNLTLKENR